jgi:RimJ/RimL family protein N-acetyltransferase
VLADPEGSESPCADLRPLEWNFANDTVNTGPSYPPVGRGRGAAGRDRFPRSGLMESRSPYDGLKMAPQAPHGPRDAEPSTWAASLGFETGRTLSLGGRCPRLEHARSFGVDQTGDMSMIPRSEHRETREVATALAEEELPIVRLRPPEGADDEFLAELFASVDDDEWDGYDDPPEDRLSGAAYGGASAIVERQDGATVGSLTWIQIPHGPNRQSLAWCIGITIHPLHRGQHYAAAAQRTLADNLFARSSANRVEAETDVDNIAERRSLERAGFVEDGIARGANWRRGRWHDMVVYSRLRSDAGIDSEAR